MTSCLDPIVPSSPSTAWCDEPIELAAVFEPTVNVAVWRRATISAAPVPATLRSMPLQLVVRPTAAEIEPFAAALEAMGVVDDLLAVTTLFADLCECEKLGLRLVSLQAPMCPRFHVDHVTLRGVVTYIGPGTEWVEHDAVDRRWLGHAAGSVADEHSGLLRSGARIERAAAFDLVVLKGTAWPGNAERGAVHRSPCSHGTTRVVLTLDALS